jgi:DNA excision repair protein ERCC-4
VGFRRRKILECRAVSHATQALCVQRLAASGVAMSPRCLNAETTSSDRRTFYQGGGVLFVTSRVLVVDLLMHTVPVELISGVVVAHAHTVTALSSEVNLKP